MSLTGRVTYRLVAAHGAKIEMKQQPARSPDFNALDAYVWRVLQKAVDKKMPRDDKELLDAIDWAWKERLTAGVAPARDGLPRH